ncbi:MAG: hypothetical protein IH613_03540 [Desulfuromonadales bacterium]|nr:hypothetical protein [Desulfuromonadales bacterium]
MGNALVGKFNVNRTRRTIEQEVPSAGASLFAYFFGVEKSKASGGTRPAGVAIGVAFGLISERNVNSSQRHSHLAVFGLSIMYIMVIYTND